MLDRGGGFGEMVLSQFIYYYEKCGNVFRAFKDHRMI
jgi:hypothetical protein